MSGRLHRLMGAWDRFFFTSREMATCDSFRVAYGVLLGLHSLFMGSELELFFTAEGVLDFAAARAVLDQDAPIYLFSAVPESIILPRALQMALLLASVGLVLGVYPRASAFLAFVIQVAFHHRNILIVDGEDTLFRLFALYLVFMPSGPGFGWFSRRVHRRDQDTLGQPWALRLVQLQVAVVYYSAGLHKLRGPDWTGGNAFYYLARLDDLYGSMPAPEWLFNSSATGLLLCWAVIAFELLTPFALFWERSRRYAIATAVAFHLGLAYFMNLYLFPWIMIVGLLSFTRSSDWRSLRNRFSRKTSEAIANQAIRGRA